MPTPPDAAPPALADADRLAALAATGLFEPGTDPALDRLARVARRSLGGAFALASLVGARRQIVKGRDGTDVDEGLVVDAICRRTVAGAAPLAIGDTAADPLCDGLPAVRDGVRAYLGVPIRGAGGAVVGSLAVCDTAPRAWTDDDLALLDDLAAAVSAEIAARATARGRGERHQEAQDQSEALFRALFDNVSQLTGLLAPDGTVVEANRTALDFAGLRREDVVGRPLWATLSVPEGMERRHREAVARAAEGETVRYEEAVRDARGHEVVLDVTLKPALGEAGLILLEGRDVTEVVHVRRLQIAMMAGLAGTWDLDLRTRAVRVSGGTDLLFGLDADAGPHALDAYLDRIHADDRDGIRAALEDAAERGGSYEQECRIVHAGGAVRWIRARGTVTAGADGRPERMVGAVADVTQQRREAEAAAQTAADLQVALDAADMGRWEVGLERGPTVQDARARAVHGLPPGDGPIAFEDAIGAVHPDDRDRVVANYAAVAEGETGTRFEDEYRVVRPGGEVGWARASGQVRDDGAGRRLVGVSRDATAEREAAEALRESEERLGFALDVAGLGQWDLDLETGAAFRSSRHDEIFGYPAPLASWTYGEFLEHVVPDDRDRVDRAFQEARAGGGTWEFECEIRRADGSQGWIAVRGHVRLTDGGEPHRMVGTVADVTPQRRAEAALRESEERYRTLFQSVTVGFCVIDLVYDRAGAAVDYRYVEVNPTFAEQTGIEADVEGRLLSEFVPDLQPAWIELFERVARTGEPARRLDYAAGFDRWYDTYIARVGGAGSDRVGILFNDVTEQREAEEAVRESEARFRGTFENAAVGIAHVGLDGQWLRVNDRLSEIVGYTRDELLERTFQDITHPDDLGLDLEQFERLLAGEIDHYQMEKRYLHRDGRTVWINLTVAPNWGDGDEIDYVISVVEDVSARKAAESALVALNDDLEDRVEARTTELARSNAELDQFAYVASHDLKAPIRAIDSLATWIAEDAGDALPDESARHLALLRQRAKRMERLLDSLLAYSRAGRREAAPEPVDTAALAREVAEMVAPPEGFDVRVEGDFPVVVTPRAPLALVLRNLVGNAIKHHDRPDGRVTVSARVLDGPDHPAPEGRPAPRTDPAGGGAGTAGAQTAGAQTAGAQTAGAQTAGAQTAGAGWAEFTVEDDGPGVAPAYRDRVFGMFQTLRPRDEVEGSGMGLAIVKKTVESRGGAVSVEGVEGGGARFRFTWPLAAHPAPGA